MLLHKNLLWILLTCSGVIGSCSSHKLENVAQKAVKDGTVSTEEWKDLLSLAREDETFLQEDGTVNVNELKDYVLNIAHTK